MKASSLLPILVLGAAVAVAQDATPPADAPAGAPAAREGRQRRRPGVAGELDGELLGVVGVGEKGARREERGGEKGTGIACFHGCFS